MLLQPACGAEIFIGYNEHINKNNSGIVLICGKFFLIIFLNPFTLQV